MDHLNKWSKPKFCGNTPYETSPSTYTHSLIGDDTNYANRGNGEFDPHCSYQISL